MKNKDYLARHNWSLSFVERYYISPMRTLYLPLTNEKTVLFPTILYFRKCRVNRSLYNTVMYGVPIFIEDSPPI